MPIEYFEATDVKELVDEVIERLGFHHVVPQFVFCYRSRGSASRRVIARIHGLSRMWQEALNLPASYAIEVISERYDRLSTQDKEKTIIHELLHVPRGFSGGFRPHKGYISDKIVADLHRTFQASRRSRSTIREQGRGEFSDETF